MKKQIITLTLCILTSLAMATPVAAATYTTCPQASTNNVKITNDIQSLLSQVQSTTGTSTNAKSCKKTVKIVKSLKKCKKPSSKTKTKPSSNQSTTANNSGSTTTSTKPSTTTPSTATTTNSYSSFQKQVVALVNKERAAAGLSPLTEKTELDKVATLKSEDMVKLNYFSHTSPTYGSPFEMLKQFGISYTFAGENIAYGQSTPEEVMTGWMNSPGHRANILNANYTQIGVGIAKKANGQLVWTQTFTRP